jgi:hypothetical protein
MNNTAPSKRMLGILLFAVGILLGLVLTAVLTWASLEAAFYGFQRLPGDNFAGLACPALMTSHETGSIQVQVSNPSNKTIEPILRVDVSTRGIPDTKQVQLKIEPGGTQQIEQPITADNIDLGSFIFAKAFRYPAYPLPNAEATCGIFILDLPFLNGKQIFSLWLALSLVLMPLGLWIWSSSLRPEGTGRLINAAKLLAVIVLVGLFVSLNGVWMLGILSLALVLLMSVTMLRFVIPK